MFAVTCTADTSGLRRVIVQTKAGMRRVAAQAVERTGVRAVTEARRGNFRNRTGKLRSEIRKDPTVMGVNEAYTWVRSPTSYAPFVEYPTRAHWIRPKAGHGFIGPTLEGQSRRDITDIGTHRVALRWYVGGKPVFARAVYHPGTAGTHYMRNARIASEALLREYITDGFVGLQSIWN